MQNDSTILVKLQLDLVYTFAFKHCFQLPKKAITFLEAGRCSNTAKKVQLKLACVTRLLSLCTCLEF